MRFKWQIHPLVCFNREPRSFMWAGTGQRSHMFPALVKLLQETVPSKGAEWIPSTNDSPRTAFSDFPCSSPSPNLNMLTHWQMIKGYSSFGGNIYAVHCPRCRSPRFIKVKAKTLPLENSTETHGWNGGGRGGGRASHKSCTCFACAALGDSVEGKMMCCCPT